MSNIWKGIIILTLISCEEDVDKTDAEKQPVFNASPQNNDLGTVMVGEDLTIPIRISSLFAEIKTEIFENFVDLFAAFHFTSLP